MVNEVQLIDVNDVYGLFNPNGMARLHVSDIDAIPRVDAVVLPCEIGETVYMIRECSCYGYDCLNNSNSRRKCSGKVYLGKKSRKCHCGYVSEVKFGLKHIADFGKTVFLNREEAETELAKMAGERQ